MKLKRLAGQGSRAAVASGIAMVLVLLNVIVASPLSNASPALGVLLGVLLLLAVTVWLAGLAVAGLDLDWLAHPGTHNGRMLASLWFAIAGAFLAPLIALAAWSQAPTWMLQLLLCLIGLTAGGFTILHNLEARRAGLLTGALPWLGIAAGAFFLVFWLGVLLALVPLVFLGFFPGAVLYAGWAIWLGVRLGRVPQTAPAGALT
jgi:hypothetical protein